VNDETLAEVADWLDLAASALSEAHEVTVSAAGPGPGPLYKLQGNIEISMNEVGRLASLVKTLRTKISVVQP
jgi:hypothetical protein